LDGAIYCPDNISYGYLLDRFCEGETAGRSPLALDQFSPPESLKYLFYMTFGKTLPLRDLPCLRSPPGCMVRNIEEGQHTTVAVSGYLQHKLSLPYTVPILDNSRQVNIVYPTYLSLSAKNYLTRLVCLIYSIPVGLIPT